MTPSNKIPLLTALVVCIAAGLYVSTTEPAVALSLTWSPPAVGGCYVAASGYIVQVETDGAIVEQDTVGTNRYTYVPGPGTHRFRVIGFSVGEDGSYNMGQLTDNDCAPTGDMAWSNWSAPITTVATVGVPSTPVYSVGVK